jgi:hypothetical protein
VQGVRRHGCILAGLSQWADDITLNPKGFDYTAAREQVFIERTGFTVCRDQSGGQVKPYPLVQLKADVEAGKKPRHFEWRSQCSCMDPQPQLFSEEDYCE